MRNFKHTIAAFLAVAMIGTLAATQASDIQAAKANKMGDDNEFLTVSETDANNDENAVNLDEEKTKLEMVDFREKIIEDVIPNKLEELRPFVPVAAYVITTTGGLNIRAGASTDSEILGSITYGQQIDIIEEEGDWYVTPFGNDGKTGYVLKEYVTTSYEEAKEILLESVMYETGVVKTDGSSLNIRSGVGTEETVILDQVADGDPIIVIERADDDWLKIYYGSNYDVGYVTNQYVSLGGMVSREEVSKKRIDRINKISSEGVIKTSKASVDCKKMPTDDSGIIKTFKNGESCLIIERGSEWTKVAFGPYRSTGYIKSENVEKKQVNKVTSSKNNSKKAKSGSSKTVKGAYNPAPSSKGQAIVNTAAKYIGVRYVYGGTSPSGFDCSGLVQYVCRQVGISVNRTSRSQYSNGVAVSKSNLQPGDLVFFSKGSGISHVGIYAGNGQVIHAPSPGKRVCYIALSKICGYSTYVGARRVY